VRLFPLVTPTNSCQLRNFPLSSLPEKDFHLQLFELTDIYFLAASGTVIAITITQQIKNFILIYFQD
jgi:hypothetical protein